MPRLLKDTFKAWINKMPGSKPTLFVIGEVEVPTTGWNVTMVRQEPQGINPKILLLVVHAVPPKGGAAQVIQQIPVRYEEAPPQLEYSQVTVSLESESVTVEVRIVH